MLEAAERVSRHASVHAGLRAGRWSVTREGRRPVQSLLIQWRTHKGGARESSKTMMLLISAGCLRERIA